MDYMSMLAIRAILGAALAAGIPWVASRSDGEWYAALLMLLPAITVGSLLSLWLSGESEATIASIALNGIFGLVAVAVFLLVVGAALRTGQPVPWAIGLGLLGWALGAATVLAFGTTD